MGHGPAPFPPSRPVLRDAQQRCARPEAQSAAVSNLREHSRERFRLVIEGVVAEKPDDCGVVADLRRASPVLPVRYAVLGDAERFGRLFLRQPALDPLLPDVPADRMRILIVLLRSAVPERLRAREKCVRMNVPVDIIIIPKRSAFARREWCKSI